MPSPLQVSPRRREGGKDRLVETPFCARSLRTVSPPPPHSERQTPVGLGAPWCKPSPPGAKGPVVPSVVSARGPPQPHAASWRELPRAPGRTSTPQPCPTPLLEARLSTSRSRRSLPRFSQTRGPWPPRPPAAGTRNRWAPGVSALGKHFDRWSGLPEGPGGMDSPIFRLSEGGNQGLGTKSRVRHHSLYPEETFYLVLFSVSVGTLSDINTLISTALQPGFRPVSQGSLRAEC